jgi:hypothetical protein
MIEADIREPEIHNDELAAHLTRYAADPRLKTFLDIGASDGRGSTQAFVDGIKDRPDANSCLLAALELRGNRIALLRERFQQYQFVEAVHAASVPRYPTRQDVVAFYKSFQPYDAAFAEHDADMMEEDQAFSMKEASIRHGIMLARSIADRQFDMVLIDGCHWTGEQELLQVLGAKVIALDDTRTYKTFTASRILQVHPLYRLAHKNDHLRFGYAIFERRDLGG